MFNYVCIYNVYTVKSITMILYSIVTYPLTYCLLFMQIYLAYIYSI